MNSRDVIFINACIPLLAISTAFAQAKAPVQPTAAKGPQVAAPSKPTAVVPTKSGIPGEPPPPAAKPVRANFIVAAFDDAIFKRTTETGQTVVIFFSGAGDPIWDKQAMLLASILREPEFSRIPSYQIDMTSTELVDRFAVKSAGTILIFKGGIERLRSTRMVRVEPIRKILRLNTAL